MNIAIYCRVSTERQENEGTIESQIAALREFANKEGYTVTNEYADNGYSGELLARPGLDKLRDDATKDKFEAVLIHSPDRLARKYGYHYLINEELKKRNIRIIFKSRPSNNDTPEEFISNGITELVAEYEKLKILERTRRGKLHKAENGNIIGSIAPYGYDYVPKTKAKTGHYKVNESEAKIVKKIFGLLVNKELSVRSIAKELTRIGIEPRKGLHWRTSTLHRILRDRTCTGVTFYNKHISCEPKKPKVTSNYKRRSNTSLRLRPVDEWIEIKLPKHLIIIDKKTFELAQKQLRRNSKLSLRNVKHKYLLRGLIECGSCSSPFHGESCHKKLYYRCGNRDRTFPLPKECNASSIKAERIEPLVWNAVSKALQNPKLIIDQVEKKQARLQDSQSNTEFLIKDIDKEIDKLSEKIDRLLDIYTDGSISKDMLNSRIGKLQKQKNELLQERQKYINIKSNKLSSNVVHRDIKFYCDTVKKRLEALSFEERVEVLKIVTKIVVKDQTVVIKGVIPTWQEEDSSLGCIASQSCLQHGRNTTYEFQLTESLSQV